LRKNFSLVCAMTVLFALACEGGCFPASTPALLSGHHVSELTLHKGYLYFGAGYCLYKLDPWSQQVEEVTCQSDWLFQRPATDGMQAYAQILTSPGEEGFFVAVDLSTGGVVWSFGEEGWPFPRAFYPSVRQYTFLVNDLVVTAREEWIEAFDAQRGYRTWSSGHNRANTLVPFVIYDSLIWYPVARQSDPLSGSLVAVDPGTGAVRETIDLLPGVQFGQVFYVDSERILGVDNRSDPFIVFAVGRDQPNRVMWSTELDFQTWVSQPILHDGLLFFASGPTVYALNADTGETVWVFESEGEMVRGEGTEHLVFFVLPKRLRDTWECALYALDSESGALVWEHPTGSICTSPVVTDDLVYAATADSIEALDPGTGEVLWRAEMDSTYWFYPDLP